MEEKKEFVVDTEPKADWAFRKLKEIKAEEEKQKEKYKAHKEELEKWNKAKLGALEASKEHFTILLKDYFPEINLFNIAVWPHNSGEVIVNSYNTLLFLNNLFPSQNND